MGNSRTVWLWLAAAASLAVGLVFIFNNSSAGWLLIVLGIVYMGLLARPGAPAVSARLIVGGLVAAAVLLIVVAAISAVFVAR